MFASVPLLRSVCRLATRGRDISIKVGDTASLTKSFSEQDVRDFARVSLDANPVHIDEEAGRQSMFGQRVVHGVLTLGLLSAVMGQKLPGQGTILLNMDFKCTAPLYIEEEVTAQVTVNEVKGRRLRMQMLCTATDKVVIEGVVDVLAPKESVPDSAVQS